MKDIGEKVVIRPEFIKLSKKNEYKQYVSVTEEGKVRDISFRGSYLEIKVSVGNLILSAVRSLEEPPVEIGEDVDVLIYRVYTFDENKAYMLENSAMNDRNSVFI